MYLKTILVFQRMGSNSTHASMRSPQAISSYITLLACTVTINTPRSTVAGRKAATSSLPNTIMLPKISQDSRRPSKQMRMHGQLAYLPVLVNTKHTQLSMKASSHVGLLNQNPRILSRMQCHIGAYHPNSAHLTNQSIFKIENITSQHIQKH